MDAIPSLTPPDEDHIIASTSVIQQADYKGHLNKFFGLNFENVDSSMVKLFYRTFDAMGTEKIKLNKKTSAVLLDYKPMSEKIAGEGYEWEPMTGGGLLVIRRENGRKVLLLE
jgi:hypothetical protein